jgi:hypothetical protein
MPPVVLSRLVATLLFIGIQMIDFYWLQRTKSQGFFGMPDDDPSNVNFYLCSMVAP